MKLVGITTYGISVRDEANINLELHDVYGKKLLEYLYDVMYTLSGEYLKDRLLENVFAYDEVSKETVKNDMGQDIYDIIYFRVKTGEYGEESEIINSETGIRTHKKSVDEADVMPFGGCIIIPSGKYTEGAILIQSLGRNGITSIIKKKFNEYVREIDPELRLVFNPVIPRVYMERLLTKGKLKTIRLVSYEINDDEAEKFGVDRGTTKIVQERVFKSTGGFVKDTIDSIRKCVQRQISYDAIIQLDDFEIDDLKLEFTIGNRNKTVSMKGLDQLVVNEDITKQVVMENGHPTFQSLCKVMRELAEEYLRIRGFID